MTKAHYIRNLSILQLNIPNNTHMYLKHASVISVRNVSVWENS